MVCAAGSFVPRHHTAVCRRHGVAGRERRTAGAAASTLRAGFSRLSGSLLTLVRALLSLALTHRIGHLPTDEEVPARPLGTAPPDAPAYWAPRVIQITAGQTNEHSAAYDDPTKLPGSGGERWSRPRTLPNGCSCRSPPSAGRWPMTRGSANRPRSACARPPPELGYVGNRAARMMRGASSNVVGLVIPDIRNSFYITVAHELSTIMAAQDYQLLLAETNDDRPDRTPPPARAVRQPGRRGGHRADRSAARGLGQPAARHPACPAAAQAPVAGLAVVRPGRTPQPARRHRHLLDLGHTRIAYIGAPAELPTGQQRLEGYPKRCASRPVPPGESGGARPAVLDRARPGGDAPPAEPADPAHRRGPAARSRTPSGVLDELLDWASTCRTSCRSSVSVTRAGSRLVGPRPDHDQPADQRVAASCGLWFVRRLNNPPERRQRKPYESVSPGSLVLRGSTAPPPASTAQTLRLTIPRPRRL